MKKNRLLTVSAFLAITMAVMLVFTGCNADMQEPSETGTLSMSINDIGPHATESDTYRISVRQGGTEKSYEFAKAGTFDIENLAPGSYTVIVEAINKGDESDDAVYSVGMMTSATVIAGSRTPCPVDLKGCVYISSTGADDGPGSKDSPYKTIAKALQAIDTSNIGTIHILNDITEDVTINQPVAIVGFGADPVTTDLDGYTISSGDPSVVTLTGKLTVNADVVLRNLKLVSSDDHAIKITKANGISFIGSHLYIVPGSKKNGIEYSVNMTDDASIVLDHSIIELTGNNGYDHVGIRVDGTGAAIPYTSKLGTAIVSIWDSSIKASQGLGIDLKRLAKADLYLDGSHIDIDTNYYAVRLYDVGKVDTQSTAIAKNSFLKGWGAFYIQADSYNIQSTISNCILTGYNNNTGVTNDFNTIPLDSSTNCDAVIENSTIQFGRSSTAEDQAAAKIYYYDNTGEGQSTVEFKNNKIEWVGTGTEMGSIVFSAETIIQKNGVDTNFAPNEIIVDAATLKSLTDQGYDVHRSTDTEYLSGTKLDGKWNGLMNPAKATGTRTEDSTPYTLSIQTISFERPVD